jgi:hypothetical protein
MLTFMMLTSLSAFSQLNHSSLPVSEYGLITFTEVVNVDGVSKETLFTNAYNHLQSLVDNHKKLNKGPFINEDSTEVNLPLAFTVYRDFPIHSPHGLIKYNLSVSVKGGRYRYVATNFVFHYLERNRYGKFVEVKGKSKYLEDPLYKGSQKLWEAHKQSAAEKVAQVTEMLRADMLLAPEEPTEEIVKVKVNEDW